MTNMGSKIKARHIALEVRSKIAASIDVTAAADRLMEHFIAEFDIRSDLSAAAYWPFRDEIDVRPLLKAMDGMGCNCLLPVMMARKEPLQFHQWKPGDALEASRFGVLEPSKFHPSATPDVVILPLLSFDQCGRRLGYGGGYYDRTLRALRRKGEVLAVGAAYQGQEVDKILVNSHDQKLDAIVTDRSVFRFPPS